MAARHHELIYLHRLMVAARHTLKKAETKQKVYEKNQQKMFSYTCVDFHQDLPGCHHESMQINQLMLARRHQNRFFESPVHSRSNQPRFYCAA